MTGVQTCALPICLVSAQDLRHWSALLAQRIESATGDDASLAVVALGCGGFSDLRARFRERAESLRVAHSEPMRRIPDGDRTALVAARERSWHQYRHDYEQRLPR